MFENFKSKLSDLFKLHFYVHNHHFDVIRTGDCHYKFEVIRKCYVITLVLFIGTVAYGIVGLECESQHECNIDWDALPSSPYNMYHQMYPRVVWPLTHPLALTAILFFVCCLVMFSFNPPIHERFLVFPKKEGEPNFVLNEKVDRMCLFRSRLLKLAYWMEVSAFVGLLAFAYVNIYTNSVYNVNLTSFVFWIVLNPLHVCYMVHYYYLVPFYVILTSKYVTIQQKSLIDKLKQINMILSKIQKPKLAIRNHRQRLWLDYLGINRKICELCKYVCEYARFWSPYLTILFATLITTECYLFYVALFFKQLPFALRLIFFLVMVGLICNQFVLIHQCAAVANNFKRIILLNRTFYMFYREKQGEGSILARNIVKAEGLQHSRLFHSYAFRLFGNYRITNKSFHIIISYTSLFFLYIVKNKQ